MRMFYKMLVALAIFMLATSVPPASATGAEKVKQEADQALGSELATALKHFYDKDYENALPIFENISKQMDSWDLMFLMGRCEEKTGRYDAAIERFGQILSKNPQLHAVRLALADALITAGRYREARSELEKIQAASTSESLLSEVDKRYARMGGKDQFNWRLSLFLGGEYDDNINSGPDRAEIKEQRKTDSYNLIAGANFCGLYDVGQASGFFWNGALDAYYSISEEDSGYNYLAVDLSTGPLWQYSHGIVKMPVGYTDTSYGERHLSGAFSVKPSIEHFFNERVSMMGTYEFIVEDYIHSEYGDYDNTMNRVTIGPNLYFNDMRHIISCGVSLGHRDADADRTTFDALAVMVSYYTKFSTNTELLLRYKWRQREYDAPSNNLSRDREDDRHIFSAAVGQEFLDRYFVSLGLTYMDNDSNDTMFDFDKTVCTLKIGCVFK